VKEAAIYTSIEAADEAELLELKKLSNQERLDLFCIFLMSIYGEEINTPRRLGGIVEVVDFTAR
jgi:hypothetical protein